MEKLDNQNLNFFLQELGILPATQLEELEEILDPRQECMQKGYYRSPYDEEGEITF